MKQTEAPYTSFPPGRLDSSNIIHICAHHKLRLRNMPKCLPRTRYDWLIRQAKIINVLEREYNQCYEEKKDQQLCAEKKWKKMVDEFCKDEMKTNGQQFECCGKNKEEEQYSCFAASAPDPEYRPTDGALSPSAAPPTLQTLRDTHTAAQGIHLYEMCQVKELVKPHCCTPKIKNRVICATKLLLCYIRKAEKDSRRKNCPQLLLI